MRGFFYAFAGHSRGVCACRLHALRRARIAEWPLHGGVVGGRSDCPLRRLSHGTAYAPARGGSRQMRCLAQWLRIPRKSARVATNRA